MTDWAEIKHFKPKEFDSPDDPGSGKRMDGEFIETLDALRELVGTPMKINSGFRTEAHNRKVGGKPTSAHLSGLAADIRVTNSTDRMRIVHYALSFGFTRIGIAKTFVHLDMDETLPQKVMWLY